MTDFLPVTVVTVDTVSVPVVVVHAQGALTADLRAFTPVVGSLDVPAIVRPANSHVASQLYSPALPRMRSGWRSLTLIWVGAATGVAALTVGLTAFVQWLI